MNNVPFFKHKSSNKYSNELLATSFGLVCVIFFWSIEIGEGVGNVPFYIFIIPLLGFFTKIKINYIIYLCYFVLLLLFVTVMQLIYGIDIDTPLRTIFTIVLLPTMSFFIIVFFYKSTKQNIETLFSLTNIFLVIQLCYQLTQVLGYYSGIYGYDGKGDYLIGITRFSGFFNEPSHVAMSLAPFLFIWLLQSRHNQKFITSKGKISLLGIFLIAPSTTLFACCLLLIVVKIYYSRSLNLFSNNLCKSIIFSCLIISIIYLIPESHSRFFNIIDYVFGQISVQDIETTSVLVLLRGLFSMIEGLLTYPIGVGIQNYQIMYNLSDLGTQISWFAGSNKWSGASILFKFTGEFGWLAIILIIYSFILFYKNSTKNTHVSFIENAFIFGLYVNFIRGAGYFSGIPLISFSILLINFLYFVARLSSNHTKNCYTY